jgi:hypothetical protein
MSIGQRVFELCVAKQTQHMIRANLADSHLEAGLTVFAA